MSNQLEEEVLKKSQEDKYDHFYYPNPFIHGFINDNNKIIPKGYKLRNWSMNRSVSLFFGEEFIVTITEELIGDGEGTQLLNNYIKDHQEKFGGVL